VCQLDMWTPPCRVHFVACAAAGCAVRDQNQGELQRACCAALCACVCLHAYDLLQLCGLLSLRRGAFFWATLFSVARFPLIFSVVDDAFTRISFLLCDASVSWINEFKQKERKKEENRSKNFNDKSRILVRTQIASSIMRLCTSMCLEIKFFSEKESAVSIESRNINLLAAAYVLVYNRLPSESVAKCVCAPRSVLASSFSLKTSPLYRKNLALYICCPFAASLLQPIAL
jgi:hypothetical protein